MTVWGVLGLVVFAALVVAALVAATMLERARKEIDRRRCETYEEIE